MQKMNGIAMSLLVATLLSACATNRPSDAELAAAKIVDADRYVAEKISTTAMNIESTLRVIERLERGTGAEPKTTIEPTLNGMAATGPAVNQPMAAAVEPMNAIVSVKGVMSIEGAVKAVADQTGLSFKTSGLSKNAKLNKRDYVSMPAHEVLGDLAKQVNAIADIVYDQKAALLEVRFK